VALSVFSLFEFPASPRTLLARHQRQARTKRGLGERIVTIYHSGKLCEIMEGKLPVGLTCKILMLPTLRS